MVHIGGADKTPANRSYLHLSTVSQTVEAPGSLAVSLW